MCEASVCKRNSRLKSGYRRIGAKQSRFFNVSKAAWHSLDHSNLLQYSFDVSFVRGWVIVFQYMASDYHANSIAQDVKGSPTSVCCSGASFMCVGFLLESKHCSYESMFQQKYEYLANRNVGECNLLCEK